MTTARMLTCSFFALSGFLLAGCQQKSTALNHVTGKVLYNGVTLQNGIILFCPDTSRGESGPIAFGKIQSDGSYTLSTADAAGAAPGWYRVSIAAVGGTASSFDGSSVPEKYRDPQLSLLQCEVKGNRDNHLDFNLD